MLKRIVTIAVPALVALAMTDVTAAQSQRQYLNTTTQAQTVLARTTRDLETLRRSVDLATRNDRFDPNRPDDDLNGMVLALIDVTTHLRDHADRRLVLDTDVQDVLQHGARLDATIQRRRPSTQVQSNWTLVRRDLDELGRVYNISSWDWSNPRYTPGPDQYYNRLEGTFQLDAVRSDNPQRIADAAARAAVANQRPNVVRNLVARLQPPEQLAIERSGQSVTIASSEAPRVTFQANGRATTEEFQNGRQTVTRATLYGDQLMVATSGNRGSDFTVTFEPVDNGRTLRVTRRIDNANLTQPVTARSFYRRTADVPQWDLYPTEVTGGAVIQDGTVLVTRLNNAVSSRSPVGTRFTLTVQSPAQFQGAVLEGVVLQAGRTQGGRTDLVFDFDSIRFRSGRTSDYTGILQSIRTPDGNNISINTENVARESQTNDAITRGTIGAAVGAIIGALAGGGKGAAIGAAIGATGGAGTVFLDGRDRLDLPVGTEVQVTTIGPRGRKPIAPAK